MKRAILFVLMVSSILVLAGCSERQAQATVPEVEFTMCDEQQCPSFKVENTDDNIHIVNAEIESQFQWLNSEADGDIQTIISSTDKIVSVLLMVEYDTAYGTDGEVWGICYDYTDNIIAPLGAYLSELGYSYSDIYKRVESMLCEMGSYEYFYIPYFYFDSNSDPILIVVALEHPPGADSWKKIYQYSLTEGSLVRFLGTAN